MRYDEARLRNCLPVPYDQFGNPGAGGVYNHWVDYDIDIPVGAESAEVTLLYQQTTWEYIQFLWLENDQQGPFLGQEGVNLLDAWLNTGMAAPAEIASTSLSVTSVTTGVPGEASDQEVISEQMHADYNRGTGQIDMTYTAACDAADHAIYYGDIVDVSAYTYSGAECSIGVGGTYSFDPGAGSFFFVVVANDGLEEGSYGEDGFDTERPDTAVCGYTQNLAGVVCE
jgi:hypothetical protein